MTSLKFVFLAIIIEVLDTKKSFWNGGGDAEFFIETLYENQYTCMKYHQKFHMLLFLI